MTAKYGVTPDTLPDSKSAARFAQELAEFEKIEISDIHVRGIWCNRVTQFRVSVAGHAPPDNRLVRYMRIARVPLSGDWTAIRTGAAAYHLKLL